MALDISDAFIRQYESDVHVAYQRMGSKLRNTVRVKNGVKNKTTFQKYGTGSAVQKTRHGDITPMNVDHSTVDCDINDWYAGDFIDNLDELRINFDERMLAANAGAYALGRKTDDMIITALDTSTNVQAEGGTVRLTTTKINTVFTNFGGADVPDDGQRFWVISPDQWVDLLGIDPFSRMEYVGMDQLPYKSGMTAKVWMSFMWFQTSGLPVASRIRKTWAYHKSCIGHAIGADVETRIDYVATKAAYFAMSKMQQGSCAIDLVGVYETECYA